MKIIDECILGIVRKRYPDAENDIVALDLYAQDIFKALKADAQNPNYEKDNQNFIDVYHIVVELRKDLLNQAIENESKIIQNKTEVLNG